MSQPETVRETVTYSFIRFFDEQDGTFACETGLTVTEQKVSICQYDKPYKMCESHLQFEWVCIFLLGREWVDFLYTSNIPLAYTPCQSLVGFVCVQTPSIRDVPCQIVIIMLLLLHIMGVVGGCGHSVSEANLKKLAPSYYYNFFIFHRNKRDRTALAFTRYKDPVKPQSVLAPSQS